MDEGIGSLEKARIFPTLDVNYSYVQVEIEARDHEKTAFTS